MHPPRPPAWPGFVAALQPDSHYGRILAAYGGIFAAGSLLRGMALDGYRPDRYDLLCTVRRAPKPGASTAKRWSVWAGVGGALESLIKVTLRGDPGHPSRGGIHPAGDAHPSTWLGERVLTVDQDRGRAGEPAPLRLSLSGDDRRAQRRRNSGGPKPGTNQLHSRSLVPAVRNKKELDVQHRPMVVHGTTPH